MRIHIKQPLIISYCERFATETTATKATGFLKTKATFTLDLRRPMVPLLPI